MEDEKIIKLFFERSEQAIKELDNKYRRILHSVSFNILNNRLDAEECINDAYLETWNSIPPAKPNPLLAFVCKIVRMFHLNATSITLQPNETVFTMLLWRNWKIALLVRILLRKKLRQASSLR